MFQHQHFRFLISKGRKKIKFKRKQQFWAAILRKKIEKLFVQHSSILRFFVSISFNIRKKPGLYTFFHVNYDAVFYMQHFTCERLFSRWSTKSRALFVLFIIVQSAVCFILVHFCYYSEALNSPLTLSDLNVNGLRFCVSWSVHLLFVQFLCAFFFHFYISHWYNALTMHWTKR